MDEAKNNGKTFNERVYQYKCYSEPEVKYEITFKMIIKPLSNRIIIGLFKI